MRKAILAFTVLAVIAGCFFFVRPAYRKWRVKSEVTHAREALTSRDFKGAIVWLRKALSHDNRSPDAIRLMGDFAESMNSPAAVYWREQLVEVEPSVVPNRFLLARAALAHGQFPAAAKSLEGVPSGERSNPEYLRLMGALAVATSRLQEAEQFFQQALTLQPESDVLRLNLAIVQVQRKDPAIAASARGVFERFVTNAALRTDALRQLSLDALRHTNMTRALPYVRQLAREREALMPDRLLELEVLKQTRNFDFADSLSRLQTEVRTNPPAIVELGRWMLVSSNAHDCLNWLGTITDGIRTNIPVTMLVADCHLAMTNWAALEALVGKQQWGEFDYLRYAFLSRALRERNLSAASKTEWSKAVKFTEGKLDRLAPLQRLVGSWSWPNEYEELLWTITTKFPSEKWAMTSLAQLLTAGGKTRPLLSLMAQEYRSDPGNDEIKNNLAALSLLLGAMEHHPHDLARAVYEKNPGNPVAASTYGFSLYQQNKINEARAVFEKLDPQLLQTHSIAGYYALVLAASGEKEKAKPYAALAFKGPILPEEGRLFERLR